MAKFEEFVYETRVQEFRDAVIAFAAQKDIPTDVVVGALADVLGIAAAHLDKASDGHTLNDRLHSFCHRVTQTYERRRHAVEGK